MKKVVSLILVCCMLISVFAAAANAETKGSDLEAAVAAVADKLDQSVIKCLYSPTGEGRFFEIHYHNDKYPIDEGPGVNINNVYYAEEELLAQIRQIGYYECPNGVRGDENKIQLGLPYSSVVSVAALDNVDYITLPDYSIKFLPGYDPQNKIDADLKEMTAQMNPDDSIMLRGVFAYEELRIYVGIDIDKCKTAEERQHYYDVYDANNRACYTAMNEEYKNRLVQNAADDGIALGNLTCSETVKVFSVETTVSAIDVLAGYDEVFRLQVYEAPYEPPTGATEVPTECPTEAPTEAPTEVPTEPGDLYRERLKEYYNLCEYNEDPYMGLMGYQELYYHRDSSGDIDWALINCFTGMELPVEYTNVVGNRVLSPGRQSMPFDTCYGIYDVKNDKFVDATTITACQYDGFVRAFDEIVGKGKPLGDIDNDDDLAIVDVTIIQRCVAEMMEYPANDAFSVTYDYSKSHYYSDFNRDGERDIVDATCIQRYLAGMDYPIG